MALAAGLAWYLASLVSPHQNPYFAPLAVVVVFQATVADTVAKAGYRIAGIVVGVAVCLLISHWFHVGALTIALAVFIGVAISTVLRLDPQITSQVGVTVVMVLASSGTPHYAEYRILESLLGAVVAVVVNAVLIAPGGLSLAEKRVSEVADLLSRSLLNLSAGEPIAGDIDQRVRAAVQSVRAAEASSKLNPFSQARSRVKQLAVAMGALEKIGMHVRSVRPGVTSGGIGLDTALQETAASVAAFGRAVAHPSDETLPRVAAAVVRARSSQVDCLAHLNEIASLTEMRDLGAILADLDQIVGEVSVDLGIHRAQPAVDPSLAFGHD